MNEQIEMRLQSFIENRNRVKSVYSWDSALLHLSCAGIYTAKDKTVDEGALRKCKELLKEKVGLFSEFRSVARSPITAMLAISENPEEALENGLKVYHLLKRNFWSSTYLPMAAMTIAQLAQPSEYEGIATRTKVIYDCMKAKHPFLTSADDSVFCALMALSDKADDVLLKGSEECYRILKEDFFSANAVLLLSHLLALCDGDAESKCQRTLELYRKLKTLGCKYGTDFELPTLGILAMSGGNLEEIVAEIVEIDHWLENQKGFGFFGGITKKQRLMYAGILAQKDYFAEETMQTAVVNGTISMIIAQEAAMCAAVAASSAAAAASSASS